MSQITGPLAASTSLSILLHGAVFAAFVFSPVSTIPNGQALAIELISSISIVDEVENDVAIKPELLQERFDATTQNKRQVESLRAEKQLLVSESETAVSITDVVHQERFTESDNEKKMRDAHKQSDTASASPLISSTSNAKQQQVILQLLHASISEKKEYPYLARRQRREGVATVGFLLNPNGTIENTRLVSSSSTNTLDRAALAAVKRIEPFRPAQYYLERAEAFKVDVVFTLI